MLKFNNYLISNKAFSVETTQRAVAYTNGLLGV